MNELIGWLLGLLGAWTLVVLIAYFLPPIIAGLRGHQNTLAIFVLTLLLGWSGIVWIIALVWSFTAVRRAGAGN
jgi:hypothetical protein